MASKAKKAIWLEMDTVMFVRRTARRRGCVPGRRRSFKNGWGIGGEVGREDCDESEEGVRYL
jgi:hypothetical protein